MAVLVVSAAKQQVFLKILADICTMFVALKSSEFLDLICILFFRGTGGTSAGINPFETLYMKMRRRLFVATTCVLGLAK